MYVLLWTYICVCVCVYRAHLGRTYLLTGRGTLRLDLNVWRTNRSGKDEIIWTSHLGDLFIAVKPHFLDMLINVSQILPNSTGFEFSFSFCQAGCLNKPWKPSRSYYFIQSWREKRWIRAFPKALARTQTYIYIYIYIYIFIIDSYWKHGVLWPSLCFSLSRHPSLSPITLSRSSWQHPVSSQSWCI